MAITYQQTASTKAASAATLTVGLNVLSSSRLVKTAGTGANKVSW